MEGKMILLLITLVIYNAHGSLLSNVFGSNMVLQRAPQSANLYGWSSDGDNVVVKISSDFNIPKKYQVVASSSGGWTYSLDPMEAGGPYTIVVSSSSNSSDVVTLTNVMFGDVILCGGQSNMQFTVNAVFNASEALEQANKFPNIRVMTVGQYAASTTPLNELQQIEQGWSVANNISLGASSGAFTYFSAVCWFTAVNILSTFPDLPIGLVSSNWGGTSILLWSSHDALANCPLNDTELLPKIRRGKETKGGKNEKPKVELSGPSGLWNSMIVPFLQMKISAFLWYQAEADVGQTDMYRCVFPAMITDWRAKWGAGDIPFFFAQLAPYTTDGPLPFWYSLPDMRLAQTSALMLSNTALISTIDAGDTGSPFTNIHPRDKQIVGYRMSLAMLAILYDQPIVYSGPTLSSATVYSQYPDVSVVLDFLPTTIGTSLEFRDASCPTNFDSFCSTWEIGLSDGSWHVGAANIVFNVGVSVTLATPGNSTSGTTVSAVRYLYSDWPVATLYSSSSGLPASPFYYSFIH